MYGLDNLLKFVVSANKSVRSQSKEDIVLNKFSRTTRTAAVAAIAGLSLSLSMPVAFAEEPVAVAAATASDSPLVNPNAKGSLTIHKYADPKVLGTPTGTVADVSDDRGTALDGVGFTIYKIKNIDLTTNEGLLQASKLSVGDLVKNGVVDDSKVTLIKNEKTVNGQIVLSGIDLGAYLVVESEPLPGYTPALPFVAYIPMTENNADPNQGVKWNYNVHAFPKNFKETAPEKSVKDKGQNVGDKVTYTVTGTVRALGKDEKLKQFKITDTIDPKLQVTNVSVAVDGVPLEESDYDSPLYSGNTVTVNLTESGLAKLKTGNKVSANIETKILESIETNVVPNTAIVFQNNPGTEQDLNGTPTPTVKTYWGGVTFKKVGTDRKGLEGAEFRIVNSESSTCDDVDVKDAKAIESKSVNGLQNKVATKLFKSEADGTVTVTGLHVNDFADNQEVTPASTYCLVETKAPKGKELLAKPLPFQLIAKEKANDNRTYEMATVTVGDEKGEVVNIDDTTPQLPLTGGAGVGILAAIGAAIVAAGAWFARRNSSQNN